MPDTLGVSGHKVKKAAKDRNEEGLLAVRVGAANAEDRLSARERLVLLAKVAPEVATLI